MFTPKFLGYSLLLCLAVGAAPAGATEPLSQESMTRLKELIRTAEVDDETRAEMILRLANLYVEEGRVVYAGEMEAGGEDHAASQVWIERSIKLFEQITARYPQFARADEIIDVTDEPNHDELCRREQEVFLRAIRENTDLSAHWQSAIDSLRIVLAADLSFREGRTVKL